VASIRDARDCLVQIEGEKIAFDDHLQLVTGRVAKLNVKIGQKAIQGLAGDDNALPGWRQGFMTLHNKEAIICN